MTGTLLIDSQEFQVVRTTGRTVAPVKWGAGVVKLREARVRFEAQKVNDEVWLPGTWRVQFRGRAVVVGTNREISASYDNYRKFTTSSKDVFDDALK